MICGHSIIWKGNRYDNVSPANREGDWREAFFLAHGDGLGPGDRGGYKFLKKCF